MTNQLFKVGDEVECLVRGYGVVTRAPNNDNEVIVVNFTHGGVDTYSSDGKYVNEGRRTLYHRGAVKVVHCGGVLPKFTCLVGEKGTTDHFIFKTKTATLADGSTASVGQEVWHPEHGKMTIGRDMMCEYEVEGFAFEVSPSDCYPRPCARLADGSVIMEGEKCWHPLYGECNLVWNEAREYFEVSSPCVGYKTPIRVSDCYPLGSRVVTPAEEQRLNEAGQMIIDDANERVERIQAQFDEVVKERDMWKAEANRQREIVLKLIGGESDNANS